MRPREQLVPLAVSDKPQSSEIETLKDCLAVDYAPNQKSHQDAG